MSNEHLDANRALWNAWTPYHVRSVFYDVDGFKVGRSRRRAPGRGVQHRWLHPLAAIIGSLLQAGLRLESFVEYPYVGWPLFPWMEPRGDGWWQLPRGAGTLPLVFSLTASRDR